MLDTENKRRSILGIKPVPNMNLDMNDRLQFMDWFSGVSPVVHRFFFWRKHDLNLTNWEQESDLIGVFIPVKMAKTIWVPVLDFPEDQ
jgi:hypothetical protein